MSSDSFQNEVPAARVNIKLDLHTGGAQKKVELPLKVMVMGDYSAGQDNTPLAERAKVEINKNNFDSVMETLGPKIKIDVDNTLADDGGTRSVELDFHSIKDFHPEAVVHKVPELQALLTMRNLLRDLKSNLLDNVSFRRELEKILKDEALSANLREELEKIAPLGNPETND